MKRIEDLDNDYLFYKKKKMKSVIKLLLKIRFILNKFIITISKTQRASYFQNTTIYN